MVLGERQITLQDRILKRGGALVWRAGCAAAVKRNTTWKFHFDSYAGPSVLFILVMKLAFAYLYHGFYI
jgi:hypothetical protein